MTAAPQLPELIVRDGAAWAEWLDANDATSPGVWLVLAKRGTTDPTELTYAAALDEALCHGWIDGQRRGRDEDTFGQRFTRRRPRSPWSQRNVGIAERLVAEARMLPSGLAEMDRAKADGRWAAAYAGPATITVPAALAAALDADAAAAATFATLSSQNRFAVLYRIEAAKRADTRARRIEQFVAMLARGETVHPQRRSGDPSP